MLCHWEEVEGVRREKGPMAATWQRLGDAAGAKGIGVNRVRVEPGRLPTPPHSHGRSEEIYYVLGGSGLLWQDEQVCEVRAGDTIVQVADHYEHTFKGGPDGLDVLADIYRYASMGNHSISPDDEPLFRWYGRRLNFWNATY